MASLTLKDIPDELMDRLRQAARAERRSLTQQALQLIDGGLKARQRASELPSPEVARQVRRWRELAGRWASDQSFEEEVAAIFTSRTAGREVDL